MRCVLLATAVLSVSTVAAYAEDMEVTNNDGIMCKDPQSLAEFTAHGGGVKPHVMDNPSSPIANRFMTHCADAMGPVQVVTKRKNTSIVIFRGQTWYVPNIDYFSPPPSCLREEAHVTFSGVVSMATGYSDPDDASKTYQYPRLILDHPVCFIGDVGEPAGRYMSLVSTSVAGGTAIEHLIGHHITVSGVLETPETAHQPPDNMMMFDPSVRETP